MSTGWSTRGSAIRRERSPNGGSRRPWHGFCTFLERIGELNARNQGFTDAFMSAFSDSAEIAAHRAPILRSLADLCRRAQRAGSMRADVVLDDVVLMLMAGRGITAPTTQARSAAARRFAALAIDAFRAPGSTALIHLPRPRSTVR